ncbi:MAG: hypothetical protein HY866_22650, partial [Chloroflexi bacterium]|nr:hypothetical protein [Chloroflexota bacterium]
AFLLVLVILLAGMFTRLTPDALLSWGRALAIDDHSPARWGALIVALALPALSIGASCVILRRQEIE